MAFFDLGAPSEAPPITDGNANALASTLVQGLQSVRNVRPDKSQGYAPLASLGGYYSGYPEAIIERHRVRARNHNMGSIYQSTTSPHGFVFDRLHITPNPINLGIVAGIKVVPISIWGPYQREPYLEGVTKTGDTNTTLTLNNLPSSGYLPTFAVYEATLQTLPTGPDTIVAEFAFALTNLEGTTLTVKGNRSLFYGFKHNWVDPVVELYQWQTSVVASYEGPEMRAPIRAYPRVSLTQNTLLGDASVVQGFKNSIFGWMGNNYAVPLWQYQGRLTEATVAGTFTVRFDGLGMPLYQGAKIAIMLDWDDYELLEVNTVISETEVEVFSPISSVWPIRTRIVPVVGSTLTQRLTVTDLTDAMAKTGGVVFDMSNTEAANFAPTSSGAIQLFKTDPLFPFRYRVNNGLEVGFSKPMLRKTDYLAAAPVYYNEMPYAVQDFTLDVLLKSKGEIALMREFLYSVAGKAKAFRVPTFAQDLTVTDIASELSNSIFVADKGYLRLVHGRGPWKDIYIELVDGRSAYLTVDGVVEAPNNRLSLSLESPLPFEVIPSQVKYVSYLLRVRLDADTIAITHDAIGLGKCQLPVVTLGV